MPRTTRKILLSLLFLAVIAGGLFFSLHALAQQTSTITADDLGLAPVGEGLGLPATDIRLIIARIIRIALGFLGVVALGLILYGGFVWMTAGGNEENIQKAKKILINAAIGLAIILSAYAIVSFVINSLVQATTGGPGGGGGGGGGPGGFTRVLYIVSMPGDDLGCGIRNIHPVIVFNSPVNLDTVAGNLIIRKKSDLSPAPGAWHIDPSSPKRIVFDPVGDCGISPPQNDCLDASTTYQIYFEHSGNIYSQDVPPLPLNCNIGNYKKQCTNNPSVEFTTGSEVDVSPPTISITDPFDGKSFPQGWVIEVEMQYTDNFGVQNIGLYVNGEEIDSLGITGCQKSGTAKINWPSGVSPTGTYALMALAADNANLKATSTNNIVLLPAHCYDDELNYGEEKAGPPACGDGCLKCAGQACTANADCASGWCQDGVCVDRMRIDSFTPTDGAASTTYVSINGQYFGDDGGHVYFRKAGSDPGAWTEAYVVNCGAGIDNWTQIQLVVKVPPDAAYGPIRVATPLFEDITELGDGWGYPKYFTVTNELKPGLCALQPKSGSPYSDTVLIGENFGSSQNDPNSDKVYFSSSTAMIRPGTWAANSVMARVPALGTGPVAVKITNDGKESNSVRYYVKEMLDADVPIIEGINPEKGANGEYITITGKNFGSLIGKVLFKLNGNGEAMYGSFDFPADCEGALWTDKQIIVKFSTSSASPGNDFSVQVQRAVDGVIGPMAATEFEFQSGNPAPGVCKIDPAAGPVPFSSSTAMNIYGEYYLRGGQTSRPYFWRTGAIPTTTEGRAPALDASIISLTDERAELRPPTTTETGPVIMYRAADSKMGNNLPFTVFNCVDNGNKCADESYKCCTGGGDAGICKKPSELCDGETRSTNYIWRFNTGPFPPTARVVERCDSLTDEGKNLPSPSPNIRWTSGGNFDQFNTCRTALVNVEFSMVMQSSTINLNTVEIYRCDSSTVSAELFSMKNTCTHIGGKLSLKPDSYTLYTASGDEFSSHEYIQMRLSSGGWMDDSYYQVVLKEGIKSEPMSYEFGGETRFLDAQDLKPTRPCGDGTAYCFIFKTDARDCRLSKVIVTPFEYWTSILEAPIKDRSLKSNADDPGRTMYYRGTGLSDQHCIMMDMSGYGWGWKIQPGRTAYAGLFGTPAGTSGNMHQVSSKANTVAVNLHNPEDAVNIMVDTWPTSTPTNIKTGESPLTIDLSNPKVVDYWPKCLEACTNAEIGAKFNVIMSTYRMGQNTVKLWRCNDENCVSKAKMRILPVLNPSDRRFLTMSISVRPFELATNTLYQVTISKTGTSSSDSVFQVWSGASLLNPSAYSKPMQEEFVWRFRTKKEKCTLDTVNVIPSVFNAVFVNDRNVYSAEARSAPDACDAKGQRLDATQIDWDWQSSSSSIATTTEFRTRGHSPFCEANCIKNGSDFSFGTALEPLCGNGAVEAGEDCDPPGKVGADVVCGLNCLRPGNASSTCGNGTVQTLQGEECDTADPATKAGCAADCTHAGSNPSTGAEEIGASICGNGMLGFGEECDLGVAPNYLSATSSMNCSPNCLHLGAQISAGWCAANTTAMGGFSSDEYIAACAESVSQCGDEFTSPDEDDACEQSVRDTGVLRPDCTPNCMANSLAMAKCSPTSTGYVNGFLATVKTEGCNSNGQYEGSWLIYSTPSLCGDMVPGTGEDPACEQNFVITHSFIDPWTLARGIGLGAPTGYPPAQVADIIGTGTQTIDPKQYIKADKGQFIIACGYKTDGECHAVAGLNSGVASNSCCYNRPSLISRYPAAGADDVCPNTYIEAVFDRYIDPTTLPGNLMISRLYYIPGDDRVCPAGEEDITALFKPLTIDDSHAPWYRRIWNSIARWFRKLFIRDAAAVAPNIYCLSPSDIGTPEVVSTREWGAYTTTTVLIHLKNALATSTDYAVFIRDGMKDTLGVSVGRITNWKFATGDKICEVNNVAVNPPEHMFHAANASQQFFASTTAPNGQLIQPVDGYRWEYDWGPAQNESINLTNTTSSINLVASKNRNGEVDLTATTRLTQNTIGAVDSSFTGSSHITVFICENPWPSTSSAAFPFKDDLFDFSTYYCRDSGTPGFGDDLPFMTSSIFMNIMSSEFMERYVFISPDNKDAIGMQVFPNILHLSVGDWYAAEGFGGNMRSMKIDGYDTITDGNNYYVDAIKAFTPYSADPANYRKFYTNIYQFSINSDATGPTKEVFEQMMSNLKFNRLMKNDAFCADDIKGNNISYEMPCNNDLDCLAQIEAIKKAVPTSTAKQYVCMNLKDKLQRNYQRLKDMRNVIGTLSYGRGLVSLWPMDQINYGKTPDTSGRGFEAAIKGGGATSLVSGRDGQALHLEQPAYLEVIKPTDIGNSSFSIGHWIKTTSTQYQAYTVSNCLFGDGYRFGIIQGKVAALIGDSVSNSGIKTCSTMLVNDGNWHHIAAVYDRNKDLDSSRKIYCYIDGVNSGYIALAGAYTGMLENSVHMTRIGTPDCAFEKCMRCTTDGTPSGPVIPGCDPVFRADFDDIRIYARALSADEVFDWYSGGLPYQSGYPAMRENTYLSGQSLSTWTNAWSQLGTEAGGTMPVDPINQLAKSGTCFKPTGSSYQACYKDSDCATVPTTNRLSYWSGDDGTIDEGSLKNNAVIEGTVGAVAGKGHGKAFEFQGEIDAKIVAAPSNEYYKKTPTNFEGFTVSAWIYPTKKNTATIIKKGGSDENGNSLGGFVLEYSGFQWTGVNERFNNGTIRFAIFPTSTDPGKYYFVDSPTPLGLNQWHHIVAKINRSGANYLLSLTINGSSPTLQTYRANKPPASGYTAVSGLAKIEPENAPIEIGSAFNGKIDNVAYYVPYLSSAEITNLNKQLCIEHDPATGWSSEDRRFLFACNTSSYAYRYSYVTTTNSFLLRMNMEAVSSSLPLNYNTWVSDFTKNLVNYSYGVCSANDEVASPYTNTCGDGVIGSDEYCDPPGKTRYNTQACPISATKEVCSSTCRLPASATAATCREAAGGSCGDGKIQTLAGETCDDGALNGTNGRCKAPAGADPGCNGVVNTCGNNILNTGEFCDTVPNSYGRPTCTFRLGVDLQTENILEPIFYFLIDLSGSMNYAFGDSDPTTRIAYVRKEIPKAIEKLSQAGTKAKVGIGSFSWNTNLNHKKNYLTPSVKFSSLSEAQTAVGSLDVGGGTYTGEGVKFVAEQVFALLSPEDKKRAKNIILVTDGAEDPPSNPDTLDYIPTLNALGIKLHVIAVANTGEYFSAWANAANTAPYISITNSGDSIAEEIYDIYLSQPCRQYSEVNNYSCAWDCNGFGGYCGDGKIDSAHEECEENTQVPCVTGDGRSGFQACDRCILGDCVAEAATGPGACGNGIVDESEACDRGAENGVFCNPSTWTLQCSYCSSDCRNVITIDKGFTPPGVGNSCISDDECDFQCFPGQYSCCWSGGDNDGTCQCDQNSGSCYVLPPLYYY